MTQRGWRAQAVRRCDSFDTARSGMKKVAIVGLGYSGAVVLERLKQLVPAMEIDVYDAAGSVGAGLAYQSDTPGNLVNRPASLMYLRERGDFRQWLQGDDGAGDDSYQPRPVFGRFIEESLRSSMYAHPAIRYHRADVLDVTSSDGRYTLRTTIGMQQGYDALVLATGNTEPTDLYRLRGQSGYINNPYPTVDLKGIRSDRIGILGNQLSAIDVALTLLAANTANRVTMLTRHSKLPNYSDEYVPCQLKVLNEDTIKRRLRSGGATLKAVERLFDEEFDAQGIDVNLRDLMRDHSRVSASRKSIYSVLSATNLVVPMLWHALPERERKLFIRKLRGPWRQLRVPIPKDNWMKIQHYLRAGRLACHVGVREVRACADGFVAQGRDFTGAFSHIINATGVGNAMDSAIYANMSASGMCVRHPYGGIQVRYDDCRVIGAHGPSDIFAIGNPTAGVFYAVSNIDVLQMQADTICRSLAGRRDAAR
ncbi:hypothetical protein D7209_25430 [Burkholderia cepacia]|nr:hypothetical protein [Burkholderia cepacia]MBB0068154.1 hypothetical protein [Burkholderia cepacia]MBB0079828.1 hypothetical protein [Burkholderia cepacia]MBB0123159.1 hypothetical protein [Burkholderia cepacia]